MSTGAGCTVFEKKPGKWYYDLQRYPHGHNDQYDRYGPFGSAQKAWGHIGANHANPGGGWELRYDAEKPYRPSYTIHEQGLGQRRRSRWS